MSMTPATRAHRADLLTLDGLARRDLAFIWSRLSKADAIAVRDDLAEILPKLVTTYGSAARTLGADWYDELRAEQNLKGRRFSALVADLPDDGRTDSLARWGVGPLFVAEPDHAAAFALVGGGMQRIIADASRDTIKGSAIADPKASSYERTVEPNACDWCSSLDGTEDTSAHDNCFCGVAPLWS